MLRILNSVSPRGVLAIALCPARFPINALPKGVESMPMGPITMMRNQLDLNGGTKAEYSSDEWAESVRFWQTYAPIEPNRINIGK